jgi:hypothetical protein
MRRNRKRRSADLVAGEIRGANYLPAQLPNTSLATKAFFVSIFALAVSILSLFPSYLTYFKGQPFLYTFKCDEADYQTLSRIKSGPLYFDFVEIFTTCDFRNIGSRPISIMKIEQVGIDKSNGLKSQFGTSSFIDKGTPKSLAPGEALVFEDFFLIPIKKNWSPAQKDCRRFARRETGTLRDVLNCLGDIEDINTYLLKVDFPGPAGGTLVFNKFAIQVELIDGTHVQEEMKLSHIIKSGSFRRPAMK